MNAAILAWLGVAMLAVAWAGWRLLVAAGAHAQPAVGVAKLGVVMFLIGAWGVLYFSVQLLTVLI